MKDEYTSKGTESREVTLTEKQALSRTTESTGSVDVALKFSLPNIGLGKMRTSGTYIGLLLQLEGEQAVSVLVDVAKELGITLDEVSSNWNDKACSKCGMSIAHCRHEITGECL